VFWQTLCQDDRFCAYDEPFNPALRNLGDAAWLGKYKTKIGHVKDMFADEPQRFWEMYSAIYEIEELQFGLSDRQRAYLEHMLSEGEHVLLESTRLHHKVRDLADAGGDRSVLVHIYRSPESFASSHLIPSGQHIASNSVGGAEMTGMLVKNWLRKVPRRATFWNRTGDYNGWGIENLVGEGTSSLFAQRLVEVGLSPEAVYALPAAGRLMAYWKACFERVEADGRQYFGDRFLSMSFAEFSAQPEAVVGRIYEAMGVEMPRFDFSHLHPANGPFDSRNPRWQELRGLLSIDVPT